MPKPPPAKILRRMTVSRVEYDAPWTLRSHHHRHYEMLMVESGEHETRLDDGLHVSHAGDLLCFAPGVRHAERITRKTRWLVMTFEWSGPGSLPPRGHDVSGRILTLAGWLLAENAGPAPEREALRAHYFSALLAEYRNGAPPGRDALVERVREVMRGALAESVTLDTLARAGGYSRFAFVREYTRRAGLSPMADLRRMRVEKARELILLTGDPLKTIAARTGFSDPHLLTRAFRKVHGLPPGALRGRRSPETAP